MRRTFVLLFAFVGSMAFAQSQESKQLSTEELKKEIRYQVQQELKDKNLVSAKDTARSKVASFIDDHLKFSGKGLVRLCEFDMNQRRMKDNADGTTTRYKDVDRYWSRFYFFLNVDAKLTNEFSVHTRLRTGNLQYSFVTFGGNAVERLGIMLDELVLNYKKDHFHAALGRQVVMFGNAQNAQFDVPTHDGLALGVSYPISKGVTFEGDAAYYDEQYQNKPIKDHGRLYGGELRLKGSQPSLSYNIRTAITAANNLSNRVVNDAGDALTAATYYDGDLARHYCIWNSGASLTFKKAKNLTISADFYQNLRNYDQNPTSWMIVTGSKNGVTPDFTKQKTGFLASVSVGKLANPKDWMAELSYLYMQKYAAMDFFAQYDWCRWASSNIQGPELRLGYRINKFMTLTSRTFFTKEIKGLDGNDDSYRRSATRTRLDVGFTF